MDRAFGGKSCFFFVFGGFEIEAGAEGDACVVDDIILSMKFV